MTIDDLTLNALYEPKPSGYIIVDGQEVAHTKQCCHCKGHFVSIKNSGKIRGRCVACGNAWTCGAPAYDVHIPFEAKLDILDGGNVSAAANARVQNKYKDQIRELDKRHLPLL